MKTFQDAAPSDDSELAVAICNAFEGLFADPYNHYRGLVQAAFDGLLQAGLGGERGEMTLAMYGDMVRCEGDTPREVRDHLRALSEADVIHALEQMQSDIEKICAPQRFYSDDHQLAADVMTRDMAESLMFGVLYSRMSAGRPLEQAVGDAFSKLKASLERLDDKWCLAVFEDDGLMVLDDLLGARKRMSREWI